MRVAPVISPFGKGGLRGIFKSPCLPVGRDFPPQSTGGFVRQRFADRSAARCLAENLRPRQKRAGARLPANVFWWAPQACLSPFFVTHPI